jgi:UDP-N-acetyl-D-mannosaminuronic acid transferase (WecB/TagA/CpsF family)
VRVRKADSISVVMWGGLAGRNGKERMEGVLTVRRLAKKEQRKQYREGI